MGNNERRPLDGDLTQCLTNLTLRGGIHRRCGVIEHDDSGARQDTAGECQALTLPTGQRHPTLSHQGLVALRQMSDIVVQLCGFGGSPDGAAVCPWVAVGNVGSDVGGKQERNLLYDTHRAAQRVRG